MQASTLKDVLAAFPGKRAVVVGDVMLDEYVWGSVDRISPEGPVPVVNVQRRTYMPGGAGNTATNVAALRGEALLLGVVGDDYPGKQLREALNRAGVHTAGVLIDDSRPTTTKTRIVAHGQHVVRVDAEYRGPLSAALENALLEQAERLLAIADACLLSDYAKGLVSQRLAADIIALARKAGKPVVVDPKGTSYGKYRGATVVKPNLREAAQVLGCELNGLPSLLEAGQRLLRMVESKALLITRGAEGMSLFQAESEPLHIAAEAQAIFDVTGAGDTVASLLAMGLAAGATLEQAARLANQAAGIVVGKVGTVPASLQELLAHNTSRAADAGGRPGSLGM
jgi:rfaE bifunctional protein kinase chain/domain